jgi:lysyl-tRNA synthetase class II
MRYLDMLWNDKSRQVLWQRSRMVRYIRDCRWFLRWGLLEVSDWI